MYTLVFKWKDDTMVVFDVYHTKHGKQRIIGNVFCYKKDDGKYGAHSQMWMFSITNKHNFKIPVRELCERAEDICNAENVCKPK